MPTQPIVAIVDDDGSALDALANLVSALGFTARGFPDAASFLSSPVRDEARCLIADVRLPGIGGLELHRRLASVRASLPTILVTAYPDETTRQAATASGALGYLAKPVEPEALLACLRTATANADSACPSRFRSTIP